MAIELDIKIRKADLRREDVISAIQQTWDALSIKDAAIDIGCLRSGMGGAVNGDCPSIDVDIEGRASVRCDFFLVDGEADDPESGLWAVVAVCFRNVESKFLMAIVAYALAKVGNSVVVDEAELLGKNRVISFDEMRDMMFFRNNLSYIEMVDEFSRRCR